MNQPHLRAFQHDMAQQVLTARARGARIIVLQAHTGSGKTHVTARLAQWASQQGQHVLFIVHRRRLVSQISQRLKDFGVQHGVIMNGELLTPATVQVASRDTLLARCIQGSSGLPWADWVIVDEAHRAHPQSEYRSILDRYTKATILLVTATPVWPDGSSFGPWAQAMVCAPPVSKLISDGFLCPAKVFAPAREQAKGLAGASLVASWKEFGESMPTVLFTSRVAQSQAAVDAFDEAGIPAWHVDASTPDDERERVFDRLETGKIKIVSNCGIITEGVDLPCVGCVQIAREAPGRVAWLQMTGRALRPYPGKQAAHVIVHSHNMVRERGGQIRLKHGFPDEDQAWSLTGDPDAEFVRRSRAGRTLKSRYCEPCELVYHGSTCPQCGRAAPAPPLSFSDHPIVEARRYQDKDHTERVAHWLNCLNAAIKHGGTFMQSCNLYKLRYDEWPPESFPFIPKAENMQRRVRDFYHWRVS